MKQVVSDVLREVLPREIAPLREDVLAAVREAVKSHGEIACRKSARKSVGNAPGLQHQLSNGSFSSMVMPMKPARITEALEEMRRDDEAHGPWVSGRGSRKLPADKVDAGAPEKSTLANLPGAARVWEEPVRPFLEVPGADGGDHLHTTKSNGRLGRDVSQASMSTAESKTTHAVEKVASQRSRLNKASTVDKVFGLHPKAAVTDCDDGDSLRQSKLHLMAEQLVRHVRFELLVSFMIIASAIHVGAQTNFMAVRVIEEVPPAFRAVELIFLVFFTIELGLRLFVHRRRFFYMWGWGWNVFDFSLVVLQITEELVMVIVSDGGGFAGLSSTFLLRLVRCLRTVRIVRILHVTRLSEELRLLVSCVLSSVKAFCWSLALILLIIYIAAIFCAQLVLTWRVDHQDEPDFDPGTLANWYGNVPRTILSLFQGLTGGVDWNDLVEPMMDEIHPWLGLFFFIYTSFAILAVMNVVTATFVENAIERAQQVKESVKMAQASRLFKAVDVDSSGVITLDEIKEHLTKPEFSEFSDFFKSIDVDASEAQCLFELLDADGSGELDFEEFLSGCMRLQGPARTIDLVLFIHDLKRGMSGMTHGTPP